MPALDAPSRIDSSSRQRPPSAWDGVSKFLFAIGAMTIVFAAGAVLSHLNPTIAVLVRESIEATRLVAAPAAAPDDAPPRYQWFPARNSERGLVRRDAERSFDGYTLYSSGDCGYVSMLDEHGQEVHRWNAAFSDVCPEPGLFTYPVEDRFLFVRRAHAFENGDIVILYETTQHTPAGAGLAKLDRDGRVLWRHAAHVHHDFMIAEDGTIYALTQSMRYKPFEKYWTEFRLPIIEEFVSAFSPDGRELKTLSLFTLLGKSPYYRPETTASNRLGDVLHSNTVAVIDEEFASHYDEIEPGDLLICLRNLQLLVVVNLDREEIVWATGGPWRYPHDPDPLPNGNILIFDNCYANGTHAGSRLLEYRPTPQGEVVWQYLGTETDPFDSVVRSVQQPLPNGNLLVTESNGGRIFEITREGDIVWEYMHPVRSDDGTHIPAMFGGRRYRFEELPFVQRSVETVEVGE